MKRNILKDPWVRLSLAVLNLAVEDADGKSETFRSPLWRTTRRDREDAVRFITAGGGCFYEMAELAKSLLAERNKEDTYAINGRYLRSAMGKDRGNREMCGSGDTGQFQGISRRGQSTRL